MHRFEPRVNLKQSLKFQTDEVDLKPNLLRQHPYGRPYPIPGRHLGDHFDSSVLHREGVHRADSAKLSQQNLALGKRGKVFKFGKSQII